MRRRSSGGSRDSGWIDEPSATSAPTGRGQALFADAFARLAETVAVAPIAVLAVATLGDAPVCLEATEAPATAELGILAARVGAGDALALFLDAPAEPPALLARFA